MRQQPMAAFVAAQYTAAESLRMQDKSVASRWTMVAGSNARALKTLGVLDLGQSSIFDPDRRHVGHDHSAGQSLGACASCRPWRQGMAVPRASGRRGRPSACVMVGV
jgi:hypothetical protein